MRILAIRGQNLASLAEPFALEFEQEPLRAAGLFAITGETGAGKSTILDALCLALYDKFPRVVAAGGNESAPDPSGEPLASGDPRAILRRGAGRGFAEADFVARDGQRYRARCDLLRARGRAAGRLQNRVRSLWRIDESGQAVETLESGVEPVNRRILELTALTFDQFRRTALLAQGDFDAFLRAEARERGELLEKITGAEIYGRLSMRAYERTRDAKAEIEALERSRREIGVMAEEDRAALVAQSEAGAKQRAALDAERQDVDEKLRRLDAHAQARAKLTQAEADRAAAAQAVAGLAGQRRMLDDLARVAPLRAPREDARKAELALAEKQAAAAQAAAQAEEARAALEAAQGAERAAATALEAAAQEMAQFAPLWEKASALDTRIATQAQEVEGAQDARQEAAQHADRKREALELARAEEQATRATRDAAQEALDAMADARPLSERWEDIDQWLSKRASILGERRKVTDALRKAQEELARAQEMGADFDRADALDRSALAELSEQIGDREAARLALDAPAVQERLDSATRAHEALQAMARLARDHDLAQEKAARAADDAARFEREAEGFAQHLAALQAKRAAQLGEKAEAERLGELAEAAADPHALALRAALEAGQPCPVCGATAHPFSASQDAARALVETLRVKRDGARRALAQTEKDAADVGAREAKARALHGAAAQSLAEAANAIDAAARDYAARLAQHPAAPAAIEGAAATIARLISAEGAQCEGLKKALASERQLSADIERLTRAREEKRAAMETRRGERDEIDAQAREAGEARARLGQALAVAERDLASLDDSLSPFLLLCDLATADLDRDPVGVRRRLEETGAKFKEAHEAFAKTERSLAELAPLIAGLEAEEKSAAAQAAAAVAAHETRRAALTDLQAERAQLLGGEASAPHRARSEDKHRAARAAFEAARETLAKEDKAKAAFDERSAGAAREAENALAARDAAGSAYAAALFVAGLTEEEAAPFLDAPPQEAEALRLMVDQAQAKLRDAETAVSARRADLADSDDGGLPETPRVELETRREATTAALNAVLTQMGVLRERLAQDEEARRRAESLSGEIDAARAACKVWEEINAAIGSASGDKFRRFAQSVTLAQLVALANQRLALLSPRYRLERSGDIGALGLQIVDRDLGDERRSTRSLSGGERFLASLALALALAGLEGRDSFVDTLFIDEGFGALDAATLDVAIDALENLQGQGRKVGVISHVESLQSRIATKIVVERRGGGVSAVRLSAPGV